MELRAQPEVVENYALAPHLAGSIALLVGGVGLDIVNTTTDLFRGDAWVVALAGSIVAIDCGGLWLSLALALHTTRTAETPRIALNGGPTPGGGWMGAVVAF
jgi:hypothetical protein